MNMRGPETLVERQVTQILENTGFKDEVNKPPTFSDKLHSDLEDKLTMIGGLLGVVGGGIAANIMVNTEGLAVFLAISTRVTVVTPLGITVGAVLGTGYGWLAAKAVNSVRSNILRR